MVSFVVTALVLAASVVAQAQDATEDVPVKACLFLDDKCEGEVACAMTDFSGDCEPLSNLPGAVFQRPEIPFVYHKAVPAGEFVELSIFADEDCKEKLIDPSQFSLDQCQAFSNLSYHLILTKSITGTLGAVTPIDGTVFATAAGTAATGIAEGTAAGATMGMTTMAGDTAPAATANADILDDMSIEENVARYLA